MTRINKYLASATGLSRRAADAAIADGRVLVNNLVPQTGQQISDSDQVTLDGRQLGHSLITKTIIMNKPVGYVCSRNGQGSRTVYDLLPPELHHLKPVGRLDKDSSGLLLLTTDGELANQLTHPKFHKRKVYEVRLGRPLQPLHQQIITDHGIGLEDGPSRLQLERLHDGNDKGWRVIMHQGRNRQIRRTFAALGYAVIKLHRTEFGDYRLGHLAKAKFQSV